MRVEPGTSIYPDTNSFTRQCKGDDDGPRLIAVGPVSDGFACQVKTSEHLSVKGAYREKDACRKIG